MTPLIVIAGPTASGKTALAIEVARAVGAEILSADSQQVYRHFELGMAKPSAAELGQAPHHGLSFVDPFEEFSAAHYQRFADGVIAEVSARGRPLVVVGGTGLYLRVLLRGVVAAPAANASLRAALTALADREGNEALHAKLAQVDAESAARLPAADRVRVIRALELFELTGVPASVQRAGHGFAQHRYDARFVVLDPPRAALYERINLRTQAMFAQGLVDEVRGLVARGFTDTAPMRAVGYAQALAVVQGRLTLDAAVADTAQKTRHYAKRQWTWFKKEPGALALTPPFTVADVLRAPVWPAGAGAASP